MRIIAGKYGGRRLASFQAPHIRPTSDRVKESLFNIWRDEVEGRRVLDLFCGTGNLGLEALSRGARSVDFVDASAKSLAILERNIDTLKVTEDYRIHRQDVFRYLKSFQGDAYDLIFIDPPFTEALADRVMGAVAASRALGRQTLVAIESGRREKIENDYGPLHRYDVREFGDKVLSFFRWRENDGQENEQE